MELCRRCVGVPILCVAGVLIIYAFVNQLSYAGAVNAATLYDALKTIIYKLFYTTSGVIGTPINVCYTYIVLFIILVRFWSVPVLPTSSSALPTVLPAGPAAALPKWR